MIHYFTVLAAAMLCALVSLCAAYVFLLSDRGLKRWTSGLMAIACGVLLGDAFLHLLPEAIESAGSPDTVFTWTLIGIVGFYLIEQLVKWQHSQIDPGQEHSLSERLPLMNLAAGALHNATDGILIATSFMVDTTLGVATTIAIVLHEIPQEITDIAVLMRGGWSKMQAFMGNFYCALMTPITALLTVVLASFISFNMPMLLAITAGGFIYIALANIMPLLLPARERFALVPQFCTLLIGVLSMQLLLWVE